MPHPQEASTPMLDFDRRAIIVYGISPSEDPPPLSRCFSKILAENESVSVCKAYRVGAMGTNNRSRARLLKVILSSEKDLELLLSHRKKLASFAPSVFFHRNYSLPERLKYRTLKEEIRADDDTDPSELLCVCLPYCILTQTPPS